MVDKLYMELTLIIKDDKYEGVDKNDKLFTFFNKNNLVASGAFTVYKNRVSLTLFGLEKEYRNQKLSKQILKAITEFLFKKYQRPIRCSVYYYNFPMLISCFKNNYYPIKTEKKIINDNTYLDLEYNGSDVCLNTSQGRYMDLSNQIKSDIKYFIGDTYVNNR